MFLKSILIVLNFLVFFIFTFNIYQLNTKIDGLKSEITTVKTSIELLNTKLNLKNEYIDKSGTEFISHCIDENYNYLVIGNSITIHGLASYWWKEMGMAATDINKDWFHRTINSLKKKHGKVNSYAINFAKWEVMSHDRDELLPLLDFYLSDKLDLVIIQLGENVSDWVTLRSDYNSMIKYIQHKCPKAQIVLIGDFWNKDGRSHIKKLSAQDCNVKFVDLSSTWNDISYQSKKGSIVMGEDGQKHAIDHDGVASHPGDKGMEYIANAVLKVIK